MLPQQSEAAGTETKPLIQLGESVLARRSDRQSGGFDRRL
jgi:hypothetical protein